MSSPTIEILKPFNQQFSGLDIQSIEWTLGQRYALEPIQAAQVTFSGWYPNGFSSPDSGLAIGELVYLWINSTNVFRGRITDVTLEYGIPYSGGTGNADFVTVRAESDMSNIGRGGDVTTAAGTIPLYATDPTTTTIAKYITSRGGEISMPTMLEGSVSNREWSAMELLQYAQFTYQMFYEDSPVDVFPGFNKRVAFFGAENSAYRFPLSVNFSDVANNSTNQCYEALTVDSLSQNFYNSIQITRDSNDYTSEINNDALRQVTLVENTIAPSNQLNDDFADWLFNTYNQTEFDITSVTCLSEAQNNWNLLLGTSGYNILGKSATVTFRGTTQRVIMLGLQMSATAESSRFTFFVAPDRYYNMFTLDSSEYGVLDTDRLGYY